MFIPPYTPDEKIPEGMSRIQYILSLKNQRPSKAKRMSMRERRQRMDDGIDMRVEQLMREEAPVIEAGREAVG